MKERALVTGGRVGGFGAKNNNREATEFRQCETSLFSSPPSVSDAESGSRPESGNEW